MTTPSIQELIKDLKFCKEGLLINDERAHKALNKAIDILTLFSTAQMPERKETKQGDSNQTVYEHYIFNSALDLCQAYIAKVEMEKQTLQTRVVELEKEKNVHL